MTTYEIELEDQGQDLTHLTVDAETGVITDAGLCSWLFAQGNCVVDTDSLTENRMVHYQKDGGEDVYFRYPMTKLSLDGKVLAEINQERANT